ncbi:MAG: ATP-binding protein [Sphaerochaeta sp.]|nr:ATP-binding protein [Sphaerochaeta sp.]
MENYKVFKEKATISFIASNYDKTTRENENIQFIADKNLRVLRSAVVYGANAAGKTKLFESLVFFKRFVINSSKEGQQGQLIDVQPFLLSEATEHEPSEFEIVFLYNGAIYRYGFEVTKDKVLSEWLFYKPKSYEFQVFYRDVVEGTVESHSTYFKKGAMLHKENLVRSNALMLSVAAQFNDTICTDVLNWFMKKCKIISSIREDRYKGYTMRRINQQDCHEKMLHLIKFADFAIQDISSKTFSEEDITDEMSAEMKEFLRDKILNEKAEIYIKSETTHHKYNASNKIIGNTTFSMDEDESHGTQKYFYLSGPILDTLESGGILFVDEFDARLHPNLVLKLFSLFNDQKLNKQGSQLIITSQNSVFLRSELLRKDQLWFVEKDRFEAAHLYSLSDFKAQKVRANENFETNYLKGKYGAIPYLNHLDSYEELVCEKEK